MTEVNVPRGGEGDVITIVLVDDIVDTRENIKKLLAFEPDFKVVGSAGTGVEAIAAAKELKPNIIIMDINMPDMDGIQATTEITKAVPTAAVIMMSVQDDLDYMRRAMLAGARNFLRKPVDTDELYNTIRAVYNEHKRFTSTVMINDPEAIEQRRAMQEKEARNAAGGGDRSGHIIAVYSPQGGVGCTTIATNLASGLMRENARVLVVDADLQFGDVGVFLNLQSPSTMNDIMGEADAEEVDGDLFESVVATHESGVKVLLGPAKPEFAEEVRSQPEALAKIIQSVARHYDFVVIDTSRNFDEFLLALFDVATKILIVGTPTLASVKNIRVVLDLFDQLSYPPDKTMLVLNRVYDEKQRGRVTIPVEVIEKHLKRPVEAKIPNEERTVLSAANKGVPVIAADRDKNKSPIKELLELSNYVYTALEGEDAGEGDTDEADEDKKGPRIRIFGGR